MSDILKNLPERARLFEHLTRQIAVSKKENRSLAVLAIRVMRIRQINQQYSYETGDKVLAEIIERINGAIRERDTLGRLTGSDFLLILPSLNGVGQAVLASQKIIRIVKQPVLAGDAEITPRVALGISVFPEHGEAVQNLVQFAELAATQAENSTDGYEFYTGGEEEQDGYNVSLENELENAIAENTIRLHYQPKIDLNTRRLIGMEALARWESPTRGPVRPDIFVDTAEKTGLILPLTLLTLNIGLRQCVELQAIAPQCSVAINLSAGILHEEDLIALIPRELDVWNFKPELLTLEVTENAVMADPGKSQQMLQQLSSWGIRISVDDFGTGQSSLRYLKTLPLNELKIDKSFVLNMTSNEDDVKIAKSVIDLSHNFGLSVVAEGIENEETVHMLDELGCDYGQGFFIARPMPVADLTEWIKARQG